MSSLLNGVLYFAFTILVKKNGKKKKRKMILSGEKNRRKTKQCYHNIYVDGKGTVFQVKLKLRGTLFYLNKHIKKEIFKKIWMNLVQANHQINMTSDHSVWSNNFYKSQVSSKSFNRFLTLLQLYESRWFCSSVCCNGDVNL